VGFFDNLGKRDEDKPKADFSNVQSGSSTTAAEPTAPVPPPVSAPAHTYTVVAGDSLSKIAKRHYGDANKWPRIYEANRDQIKNPDLIHPGQQLKIPEA
jgi:nucleoid-associated protein YgaU